MKNEVAPYHSGDEIKKIAILRALNLGDSLCIIPAIRALKNAFPEAEVTLIGLPWQKKFIKRFSDYFQDFISFPGWPGLPEQAFVPSKVTEFLEEVQHRQFDLVLQMQGSGSFTNPMCMLFDGKRVAGLRMEGNYCPDEKLFPVFREDKNEIERFLYLIKKALAIPADNASLEFPITQKEYEHCEQICERLSLEHGNYVCIHPGARDAKRRWPAENFAFIGDRLAEAGYTILITGDVGEKALTKQVAGLMNFSAIDLVAAEGHTGLGELAALIENGAALFCNDTGVSHIASATKTPSVIVFSAYSDPGRWAPLDKTLHVPVYKEQAVDPINVLKPIYHLLKIKRASFDNESFRTHSYA